MTFIRKIDEILPFAEIERPDPKLPKGVTVLSQRGIPGFRTHRYRVVREGAFAVRERYSESYPPTHQIVRVGTGDAGDADAVADDPHPEYVADDYLVLLQGPDVKGTVGSASSSLRPTGNARRRRHGRAARGGSRRASMVGPSGPASLTTCPPGARRTTTIAAPGIARPVAADEQKGPATAGPSSRQSAPATARGDGTCASRSRPERNSGTLTPHGAFLRKLRWPSRAASPPTRPSRSRECWWPRASPSSR